MSKPSGSGNAPQPERDSSEASEHAALHNDMLDEKNIAQLKHPRSLQRLRDRVQTAVRELQRLRAENAALTERVRELEAKTSIEDLDGTVLSFDEEPEDLQRKVESFIEAIDQYLAEEDD